MQKLTSLAAFSTNWGSGRGAAKVPLRERPSHTEACLRSVCCRPQ